MNLRHFPENQKDKEEMSNGIFIQSILREEQGQWLTPKSGHYQVNYLMSVCLEGRIATGQKVMSIYRILSCKVHRSYVLGPKILLKIEKGLLNEIIQSLTLLYFIVLQAP